MATAVDQEAFQKFIYCDPAELKRECSKPQYTSPKCALDIRFSKFDPNNNSKIWAVLK